MSNIFFQESGKGKPVIFLHGFCENHEIWSTFTNYFSDEFKTITIDLPGFGKSPQPDSVSIDSVGKIIIDWLDELKFQNVILVGHSLGGYIALAIANQRPELVAGLALFHSTAYPDNEEKRINRNRTIAFVKKNGVDPFIDTFIPGLFFKKDHPAKAIAHKIGVQTEGKTLIRYTEAMRDRVDRTNVLKTLSKPILILAGAQDSIIPLKSLEEQVTFLQKPIFKVLDQSAHMGFFEQPDLSHEAIQKFISSC